MIILKQIAKKGKTMIKLINLVTKLLLGYPLYFMSGFIHRKNNIWLFSSLTGAFKDNGSYLYQYVINNPQYEIIPIWISTNKESILMARHYGQAYLRWSIKGLYYSLMAKVYISSGGVQDINFFTSRGAIKVNLWHGIPIKKIGFDSENSKHFRKFFQQENDFFGNLWKKFRYPMVYIKYDLFLSPSQYVADYSFKSAFNLKDENIIFAQYPRVSFLQECEPIKEYKQYNKVFLYAPTWRDNGNNFLEQAQIDFKKLNELMKQYNALFLIKFHSNTKLNIDDIPNFDHLKFLSNDIDPMQLLKSTDCLITDYSSIYFDYLILNRPIIYFAFDLDDYLKNNREMYFQYNEILAGIQVRNFTELYQEIYNLLNINDYSTEIMTKSNSKLFRKKFMHISEGNHKIIMSIKTKTID